MFASLGKDSIESELDKMVNEAPGPINFTMFLTLFGEKLNGTDPEEVIKNAFACMDIDNVGSLSADTLRNYLTTMGDRFSSEEADLAISLAPIVSSNQRINYNEYAYILTHGTKDETQ